MDCEKLFPNSLLAFEKGLALPIYEKLEKTDVRQIAKVLSNTI